MSRLIESWVRGTSPAARVASFLEQESDPWECMHLECAPPAFGAGSTRSFTEYFSGTSRIAVASLDDLCAWLRGCECLSDQTLFLQEDFWQHPLTFEQIRKGDCEDHALWAWRKLAEMGIPARFTAGRWKGIAHAWIGLELDGNPHLLETTRKTDPMLRRVDGEVRAEYCPALSVDQALRTYVHAGYPQFAQGGSR